MSMTALYTHWNVVLTCVEDDLVPDPPEVENVPDNVVR